MQQLKPQLKQLLMLTGEEAFENCNNTFLNTNYIILNYPIYTY